MSLTSYIRTFVATARRNSMNKNTRLDEYVPEFLRLPIDNPSNLLPLLLPQYLGELDIESSFHYIQGALQHQDAIQEKSSKWFPGTIQSIEIIERKANGRLFGRKARIHFTSHDRKNRDEITEQHIDTGWIEFYGWFPEQLIWEITLARTIYQIASDNVGNDVSFQKEIKEMDNGEKARTCINVRPKFSSIKRNNQDDETVSEQEFDTSSIEQQVRSYDDGNELEDEEISIIAGMFTISDVDRESVRNTIAGILELTMDDMREPNKVRNIEDDIEWATVLFLENIE